MSDENWEDRHSCPKCGSPTLFEVDCPGWGHDPVKVCYPSCGNANVYLCLNEVCGWWWREPNKRIPTRWNVHQKAYVEMGPAPSWLAEAEKELELGFDSEEDDNE